MRKLKTASLISFLNKLYPAGYSKSYYLFELELFKSEKF